MNSAHEVSSAPKRFSGSMSGLHWEVEQCPDASPNDALKPAFLGGLLGFAVGFLTHTGMPGRLLLTGVGAVLGASASKYHVNVDWDPDHLREGGKDDSEHGDDEEEGEGGENEAPETPDKEDK